MTPVLYLSHGAPPLADDPTWTKELNDWSSTLPRPEAVLMVSAHWEEAPTTLGATTTDSLLDFQTKAPAAGIAHPRTEHFAPLFVALGAAADEKARTSVEGFWYGLSKRSVQFT